MEGDDVNDKEQHHTLPILLAVVVNTTQVDLSWSAIEGGPSGYKVEWRPGIGGPWHAVDPTHEGAGLAYSQKNLMTAIGYLYRVRAVFVDGETGEWSDEAFVVTLEDKRQNLKKWLFIGGAIVAITTVALVLLQLFGSKGPLM